ncbi:Ribosome biogenesis regulatory protein-like [Mizuhopecten yessoensis]|uniref:Ribosome biogenesis regulatory protein n=1 Tax=Mizuhopecten yessoensis TaxID=6573 RepID=A0A210QVB8_MIZYE|nr:Ribosome biogenesis regulatory protein-like [Mizuhopecten yessoensis]
MADLVEQVLAKEIEKQANYKTIEVTKDIDLEIDEGNLLAVDTNPFDIRKYKSKRDVCLKDLARDNAQLLINRIFQLPTEKEDGVVVVKVPKARAFTKWEEYAQMKGIQNKKRSKMVWDEQTKEHSQGTENKKYDYRNIARVQQTKVPGVGLTPTDAPSKDHVSKALAVAKRSTASVGKFTDSLRKEKPSKFTGKKRKFEENYGNLKNETSKQLDILQKLKNKEPVVDVARAVNTQMMEENSESSGKTPNRGKSKGFGGGKKGKGGPKGSFKGGKGFKGGRGGKGGGGGRGGYTVASNFLRNLVYFYSK